MRSNRSQLFVIGAMISALVTGAAAAVPAGTIIVNRATLTYSDSHNAAYTTSSNANSAIVANVSGVSLSPNEKGCSAATDSFSIASPLVKTFTLTNSGNRSDSFMIASATTSAGKLTSLAFVAAGQTTPASINSTHSPSVASGGMLSIVVTIDASSVASGSNVVATVSTVSTRTGNQNGATTAAASQCGVAAAAPNLSGLTGPSSSIVGNADGMAATTGNASADVVYSAAFVNSGGGEADNVRLVDPLPTGMTYIANSTTINGTAVRGVTLGAQSLSVPVGTVKPAQRMTVAFHVTIGSSVADGQSLINVMSFTASNEATRIAEPAAILVGTANVVFDASATSHTPCEQATLALVSMGSSAAVTLRGAPIAPNLKNTDPYTTAAGGTYGLGLSPAQAGSYELVVSAPGYTARRIKIQTTADATDRYYSVVESALDTEPLASAGSFSLVTHPVTLGVSSGQLGNIPMFRAGGVAITTTVDRTTASAGDRLIYTSTIVNGTSALGQTTLSDALPAGVSYAPGTGRVDGAHVEPIRSGSTLTWSFASLTQLHTIVFASVILPSVGEETVLTNVATADTHLGVSVTGYTASARATATTDVVAGVFSNRSIITGRVYLGRTGSARFDHNDTGVAGVRIYLEDGESVTTDGDGKYDFPSVRPGMHVLRLDTTSLPASAIAFDDHRIDHEHSTQRLVHDPYDGELLQNIDFAVRPI